MEELYKKLSPKDLKKLLKNNSISLPKVEIEVEEPEKAEKPPIEIKQLDPVQEEKVFKETFKEEVLDDEELSFAPPEDSTEYHPAEFRHPLEMLGYFDKNLKSGAITLHKWQAEASLLLGHKELFRRDWPFRLLICAANGSGKDAYINAPLAIWFILTEIRSKVIITSSSYIQLKTQTESYIRTLARQINKQFEEEGICEKTFIIKKEHIICTRTGSEIIMFVTDDPGRAEGHHPFPDYPQGKVLIIVNEAKSVPEEIFEALSRCTFHAWVEVSTPGATKGHFYKGFKNADLYPEPYDIRRKYAIRVTSYDCSHISKSKIEEDKEEWGENSPLFRSKHLALFTDLDQQFVITEETLIRCLETAKNKIDAKLGRRAGLDLAAGGDENALYVFDENVFVAKETFIQKDTTATARLLVDFFKKYTLKEENIYADDGGVGRSIIYTLRDLGWTVNRVLNQSPPQNRLEFGSRGTEQYFRFARLVEECVVILPKDDKRALEQLAKRQYKQSTSGKIVLLTKREMKACGLPSPDRSDAIILAFTGVSIHNFRGKKQAPALRESITQDKLLEYYNERKFRELFPNREVKPTTNPAQLLQQLLYHGND